MATVLCVGIAALDQVFRVGAMPSRPEKYRSDALHVTGGGTAANAAVAAARLGAAVRFYGVLRDDRIGDEIAAGLVAEDVDCGGVRRVAGGRSPLSAILVDRSGERLIVSYADLELPCSTDHLPGMNPAGVGGSSGTRAGRRARRDSSAWRGSPAFPPSSTWVAVTHDARGVLHWRGREVAREPAFRVRAVDRLGAGDTWHGAFAVALADGAPEEEAMRWPQRLRRSSARGSAAGTARRAKARFISSSRVDRSTTRVDERSADVAIRRVMMMRSVLSVAALLAATAALAQPRPSTTAMPCSAVRALVASQGAVVLGTGPHTYDRYVAHQGFCGLDQITEPAHERSADTPQCFVGYRCVSRFRDTPETVR